MEEKINVENVNVPGYTTRVSKVIYGAMHQAMWKVLPVKPPGLTQAEIREAVIPHLPEDFFQAARKRDGGRRPCNWIKRQKRTWCESLPSLYAGIEKPKKTDSPEMVPQTFLFE